MSAIILLISLILALAAGYFFLQWKCSSKKEKLEQIVESNELEEYNDISELENLSPSEIKTKKKELEEGIKKVKELQKKKSDELSEEEQKSLNSLPALQEIQILFQEVEKKEDLGKKVYGMWDYGYAGGIALGVFLVSVWLVGKIMGLMKGETEK